MCKYFFDSEFNEGFRKPISWLPTIGTFNRPYHFIDLISIAIVAEDGREYQAVSKDFNLNRAWNKFEWKPDIDNGGMKKVYWLRDNVLDPISTAHIKTFNGDARNMAIDLWSGLSGFRYFRKYHGKSNNEIAFDIVNFINSENFKDGGQFVLGKFYPNTKPDPEFYAYYAYYDWVLFCSLFGTMMDLPKGFPMYCRDLKQMLDDKAYEKVSLHCRIFKKQLDADKINRGDHSEAIDAVKNHPNYPKQKNEHLAIDDARWNLKLYKFIKSL